ncbi:MAG: CPBP family intramembrane metalloprotease [Pseudobutyrivibrio sp.]|nr:CPBP family intramembrane metalloprotease [Pseudobutyrivibrio sp.]
MKKTFDSTDFTVSSRNYVGYRWFKPIIVGALTWLFQSVFGMILMFIAAVMAYSKNIDFWRQIGSGGYDDLNVYTPIGALFSLGIIAAFIPALFLATKIVKDRPFKSYFSSYEKWNMKIFGKSLLLSLAVIGLPVTVLVLVQDEFSGVRFTFGGFILCLLLVPLQSVAEEFVFRGLIMQTVGGWFRYPLVAIIAQTIVFAMLHPYNWIGVTEIVVSGLVMGTMAWYTKGIETSSALHIVNNTAVFMLTGFGFGAVTSEVTWDSALLSIVLDITCLALVVFLDRKYNILEGRRAEATQTQPETVAKVNHEETVKVVAHI